MIEIKKEKKIWENYVGLIQVEVKHTYPELYTAGAVLVLIMAIQPFLATKPFEQVFPGLVLA